MRLSVPVYLLLCVACGLLWGFAAVNPQPINAVPVLILMSSLMFSMTGLLGADIFYNGTVE